MKTEPLFRFVFITIQKLYTILPTLIFWHFMRWKNRARKRNSWKYETLNLLKIGFDSLICIENRLTQLKRYKLILLYIVPGTCNTQVKLSNWQCTYRYSDTDQFYLPELYACHRRKKCRYSGLIIPLTLIRYFVVDKPDKYK